MVITNVQSVEPYELIKQKGEFLSVDQTKSIVCPYCIRAWELQGRPRTWSPRKSMSITRTYSGYLYICFRATCAHEGIVGSPVVNLNATTKTKLFVPSTNTRPLLSLPAPVWETMLKPHGVSKADVLEQHIQWDAKAQRVYMPVFNRMGYVIGGVGKAIEPSNKPKALIYRDKDVPMLHYPLKQDITQPLVLVEDIISSIKVSKVQSCAALLGSNITKPILKQLLNDEVRDIILMLDADVGPKSMYMKQKLGSLFGNFSVCILSNDNDPKDYSLTELKELLK